MELQKLKPDLFPPWQFLPIRVQIINLLQSLKSYPEKKKKRERKNGVKFKNSEQIYHKIHSEIQRLSLVSG